MPFTLLALTVIGCRQAPRVAEHLPAASDASLTDDSTAQSAARFTQTFYDWYNAHADRLEIAVKERPEVFEPRLLSALQTDLEASAKNPQEIVGLDWDPFTASQDPCDPYKVDGISRRGDTILVAMRGMCTDTAPRAGPDVIAEVARGPSGWVFVDLRHPADSGSLRADLAKLREARDSVSRNPRK